MRDLGAGTPGLSTIAFDMPAQAEYSQPGPRLFCRRSVYRFNRPDVHILPSAYGCDEISNGMQGLGACPRREVLLRKSLATNPILRQPPSRLSELQAFYQPPMSWWAIVRDFPAAPTVPHSSHLHYLHNAKFSGSFGATKERK